MSFRTLQQVIQQANGEAINTRDGKATRAHLYFDMYWKVAVLLHPRDKCGSIWVVGHKVGKRREWVAGTSVVILRYLNTCFKLYGIDDNHTALVIMEPLGNVAHLPKPSKVAPLLESISIPISFADPHQQSFLDDTPKGTPCLTQH